MSISAGNGVSFLREPVAGFFVLAVNETAFHAARHQRAVGVLDQVVHQGHGPFLVLFGLFFPAPDGVVVFGTGFGNCDHPSIANDEVGPNDDADVIEFESLARVNASDGAGVTQM